MKALIIGGAGFVGEYLLKHLKNDINYDVYITKLKTQNTKCEREKIYNLNILNYEEIVNLLNELKPDYIFHLAAQSSVSFSWEHPDLTVDINIKGCINLLEAVRCLNINSRILLIGSAEEYGKVNNKDGLISETQNINPCNIYAVTKACQNMIGQIYADGYNMDIMMVRAFNHIGPNQTPIFVVADFCKQVAEIENNLREPIIKVGNLSAKRDFTDVRDVVKAYSSLIKKGIKGETYNVGSGKAIEIKEILNIILSMANCEINIEIDKDKLRPVDVPIVRADISKILNQTSWQPQINIKETLKDTLDYWRNYIKQGENEKTK